eukprot:CAMPEP_0175729486 /NCGR_PEP_ID=MMETSP0097-20121207/49827_1 /TAXON_ID=311494 /ORGANISM="Alexandrium monilatum, Strain CCMP3105" /LENGTH=212 /DNA_ID=CAMNT_0017037347 /DNA_START=1 /DNA_END=636 /DNA_ORIENTATION=+
MGAEPMQIVVTECLTGRHLELSALPSDSIGTIRQRLSDILGVSLESAELQLLYGERILKDGDVAADLPAHGLQCLRMKKTAFSLLPSSMCGCAGYLADGLLAPDGKIYFAPFNADRALVIDPSQSTVETLGPALPGGGKYRAAGVLAHNGKIYFAPSGADRVLVIDPRQSTVETLGPKLLGSPKYRAAGVLAPDGRIYFAPHDADRALVIDP